MLIGLTGYAGAGKDTAGTYLVERHGFTRVAFADKVRELAYAQNPEVPRSGGWSLRTLVDRYGWEVAKRCLPGVREILQEVGMAHRHVFGADFWVIHALGFYDYLCSDELGDVVVTDVRFDNEAERIRELGGVVVHIHREGVGPFNVHVSEQLPRADYLVANTGTVQELHGILDSLDSLVKEISA